MFPKAAKRLTSLTWKSRLMKISLRRLELDGRAQQSSLRLFYICLLERLRNPWELRSWELRFFRWQIRVQASEFGVECLFVVCVSRNLEEIEISNSFIVVFRISRCLFRCFMSTEIGYKTSFQLLLLWKTRRKFNFTLLMKLLFDLELVTFFSYYFSQ